MRDGFRVGHAAFRQGGQAAPDVLVVVVACTLQGQRFELGLEHLQRDGAAAQFLFGDGDLRRAEAALVVGRLQRGARRFDVGKPYGLADIGRQQCIDFGRPEHRTAGNRIVSDLESRTVSRFFRMQIRRCEKGPADDRECKPRPDNRH